MTFKYDLHTHTTVSDGKSTLEELVLNANDAGLDGIAVTDHDTLIGIPHVLEIAKTAPIHVLAGIEVSAADPKEHTKVHVLGYGAEKIPNNGATAQLMDPVIKKRQENAIWQIERMQEDGINISLDCVKKIAHNAPCIYKQHILACLTDAPYGSPEYQDISYRLFVRGGKYYRVVMYPDGRDVVKALSEDGAIPVLAHPGQSENFGIIRELVELGLKGIERIHPDHSPEDIHMVDDFCEHYNLIATGGSDYHDPKRKARQLGDFVAPQQGVKDLFEMLGVSLDKDF